MTRDGWHADDAETRRFFDDKVREFGLDARAADWGSRQSQHLRFSVLASVAKLDGSSVLDVGCGTGEFLEWLRAHGIRVDYIGVDLSPGMVEAARRRFPDAAILEGSVIDLPRLLPERVDHVFASGIFYHRKRDPEAFVGEAVAAMFAMCRRSLSFNSLSAWAPHRSPDELYLDPAAVLALCRRHSSRIAMRHDYHAADFTVHMYRDNVE